MPLSREGTRSVVQQWSLTGFLGCVAVLLSGCQFLFVPLLGLSEVTNAHYDVVDVEHKGELCEDNAPLPPVSFHGTDTWPAKTAYDVSGITVAFPWCPLLWTAKKAALQITVVNGRDHPIRLQISESTLEPVQGDDRSPCGPSLPLQKVFVGDAEYDVQGKETAQEPVRRRLNPGEAVTARLVYLGKLADDYRLTVVFVDEETGQRETALAILHQGLKWM